MTTHPRRITIRIIVALIVVTVSVLWIPAFDPFAWNGPVSSRWPRLGIPEKDGEADLSGVVIYFSWPPYSYSMGLRGNGRGSVNGWLAERGFCETPVELPRDRVEAILDKFELLDFLRLRHTCKRDMYCSWIHLRLELRIGARWNYYLQTEFPDVPDLQAEEAQFHGLLGAVADEIYDACDLDRWNQEAEPRLWRVPLAKAK